MIVAWYPVSKIGDRIATRSRSADRHKQQIPPLRCAPVGMTNDVNHFRDGPLEKKPGETLALKPWATSPLYLLDFSQGDPKLKHWATSSALPPKKAKY
jgi:hypothetical protein